MNSGTEQGELVKYLLGPQSEEPDEAAGFVQRQQDERRLLLSRGCPVASPEVCRGVLLVWAMGVFDVILGKHPVLIWNVNLLTMLERKMNLK